jgi:hypothetical protein
MQGVISPRDSGSCRGPSAFSATDGHVQAAVCPTEDEIGASVENSAIRKIVLKRQYPSNTNLGITCGRGRRPTGLSTLTSGGSRECGTPSVVGHEPIAHLNACPEHGEDAIDASKAEPFDPSRKHLGYVRAFAVGLLGQLGMGHSRL